MARPVNVKPSGKGRLPNGRKHLNASLPQQLVFDFNAIAKKQGHGRRDALIEEILRHFLEKIEPTSRSLSQPPSNSFVRHVQAVKLSRRETATYAHQIEEQEAIRVVREHAEEILAATSAYTTRKPPKRALRSASSTRKRKAS